jgi:transcriptional regulator with XRE-family HTH domain
MKAKKNTNSSPLEARTQLVMAANRLSIIDLAAAMGVAEKTARKYYFGNFPEPILRMIQLSDLLDVDLDWWLRGKKSDEKPQADETKIVKAALSKYIEEVSEKLIEAERMLARAAEETR